MTIWNITLSTPEWLEIALAFSALLLALLVAAVSCPRLDTRRNELVKVSYTNVLERAFFHRYTTLMCYFIGIQSCVSALAICTGSFFFLSGCMAQKGADDEFDHKMLALLFTCIVAGFVCFVLNEALQRITSRVEGPPKIGFAGQKSYATEYDGGGLIIESLRFMGLLLGILVGLDLFVLLAYGMFVTGH